MKAYLEADVALRKERISRGSGMDALSAFSAASDTDAVTVLLTASKSVVCANGLLTMPI